jgi:ferredoxin
MCKVSITSTGEEFYLPKDSYLTDAEEFEVNGLKFGCRKGACGICAIEVVDGKSHLSVPQKKELKFLSFLGLCPNTVRLACQCQITGDIAIKPI